MEAANAALAEQPQHLMVLRQDRKLDLSLLAVQDKRRNAQSAKITIINEEIKFRKDERCPKNLAIVDITLTV
jgi:hypothetical protein